MRRFLGDLSKDERTQALANGGLKRIQDAVGERRVLCCLSKSLNHVKENLFKASANPIAHHLFGPTLAYALDSTAISISKSPAKHSVAETIQMMEKVRAVLVYMNATWGNAALAIADVRAALAATNAGYGEKWLAFVRTEATDFVGGKIATLDKRVNDLLAKNRWQDSGVPVDQVNSTTQKMRGILDAIKTEFNVYKSRRSSV